jgi:hypothetical protein
MSIVGFAAILQTVLGGVLDRHWDGILLAGRPIYSAEAYSAAFSWLFASALLSFFALLPVRETGCRMQDDPPAAGDT